MLMRFLTSLQIPLIAQLRDSQNYVHAAAEGNGIYDLPQYRAKQDVAQMNAIIEWLDDWRTRKLDLAGFYRDEHAGAEVLTPEVTQEHR